MATPEIGLRAMFPSGPRALTSEMVSVDVEHGCRYDWSSGTFRLLSATGQLVLDTRSGLFDGAAPPQSDYDRLVPVQLSLGGDIRWRGKAAARPLTRLSPAPTMMWPLRGQHWQALRRRLSWQQDDTDSSCEDVVTDMITAGGAGLAASDARWPAGVRLRHAEAHGSLAQTLTAAALATGTMPVEFDTGAVALCDLQLSTVPSTPAVAGQVVEAGSTIDRLAVADKRVLVLAGRIGGAPEAEATLDTGIVANVADTARRRVTAVYLWPADAASVVFTAAVAANADTTVHGGVRARHQTWPGGRRVTSLEATASAASAGDDISVDFRGRVVREESILTGEISVGVPDDGDYRHHTVPWIDWGHADHDTSAQAEMLGIVQSPVILARLIIPLWSDAAGVPLDPAVKPGYRAIFHAGPVDVAMSPVLSIRYIWAVGRVPRAVVTGLATAVISRGPGPTWADVDVTAAAPELPAPAPAPDPPPPGPAIVFDTLAIDPVTGREQLNGVAVGPPVGIHTHCWLESGAAGAEFSRGGAVIGAGQYVGLRVAPDHPRYGDLPPAGTEATITATVAWGSHSYTATATGTPVVHGGTWQFGWLTAETGQAPRWVDSGTVPVTVTVTVA